MRTLPLNANELGESTCRPQWEFLSLVKQLRRRRRRCLMNATILEAASVAAGCGSRQLGPPGWGVAAGLLSLIRALAPKAVAPGFSFEPLASCGDGARRLMCRRRGAA